MSRRCATGGLPGRRLVAAGIAAIGAIATAHAAGDRALGEYLAGECRACHQDGGRRPSGVQGGVPAIAGIPADRFIALIGAYRDKTRGNQVMATIAARLTPDEIEALAAYYGSLTPAGRQPDTDTKP